METAEMIVNRHVSVSRAGTIVKGHVSASQKEKDAYVGTSTCPKVTSKEEAEEYLGLGVR
jgi:hypothetical protein